MMNENKEPQGNPWIKSALILAGVFLALLMFVTVFDSKGVGQKGTAIAYSDFRDKVAADAVKEVSIAPDRISGLLKNDQRFTAYAVPDPTLPALLNEHGVKYSGQPEEQPNFWMILLYQSLPFVLILGIAFFVLRQMQKGGGAGGAMGFGKSKAKLHHRALQRDRLLRDSVRHPCQRRIGIGQRRHGAGKAGRVHQIMIAQRAPHPHAVEPDILIARIIDERDGMGSAICPQRRAPLAEQRPQHHAPPRPHTGQAAHPRAAIEPQQDRLDLVVRLMRRHQPGQAARRLPPFK
jgi:preprotein translocase subunit SecG